MKMMLRTKEAGSVYVMFCDINIDVLQEHAGGGEREVS